MTLKRADFEARLIELRAARSRLEASVQQGINDINAYNGAIQDVEYWLGVCDEREREEAIGDETAARSSASA